jgi:hypothetical protein
MQRFSKTAIEGYLPIYANNMFTRVNLKATVNSMKNLHSFCTCNSLSAGRIAKLQGGYYILNDDDQWEFICKTLDSLTFEILFNKLNNLNQMKTININGKDFTIEELNRPIEKSKNSAYPIYCQLLDSNRVVKFTDQTKGILVKNESNGINAVHVGQASNHYRSHDDKNTWKLIPVCSKTGFFHGQLVWAWDNKHTHFKGLGFYNVKKAKIFPIGKGYSLSSYTNYAAFEGDWPNWALEAHKTLEV